MYNKSIVNNDEKMEAFCEINKNVFDFRVRGQNIGGDGSILIFFGKNTNKVKPSEFKKVTLGNAE